jgi:4-amino-4-deoxy-L-arabinose transferase-like glycosyltransferase
MLKKRRANNPYFLPIFVLFLSIGAACILFFSRFLFTKLFALTVVCMGAYYFLAFEKELLQKIEQQTNAWLEKIDWSATKTLFVIIAVGFVIRLVCAWNANFDLDEGIFSYDASLILRGHVPFADYATGAPFLLYALAGIYKIFGFNMYAGRMLTVLLTVGGAYWIYLIGSKLFSKKIGCIAAAFYMLLPFNIYFTYIIHNPEVSIPLCLCAFALAIPTMKKNVTSWRAFTVGLIVGLGYLARRTACIYIVLIGIVWLLNDIADKKFDRSKLLKYFLLALGFIIIIFIPMMYFAAHSSWSWIDRGYGIFSLTRDSSVVETSSLAPAVSFWGLTQNTFDNLNSLARVLVQNSSIVLLGLFAISCLWKTAFFKKMWVCIIDFITLVALYFHLLFDAQSSFLVQIPLSTKIIYSLVLIAFLFWGNILVLKKQCVTSEMQRSTRETSFGLSSIGIWFGLLFIAYILIKKSFDEGYFFEFIPVLSVLSAYLFCQLPKNFARTAFLLIAFSFVLSGLDFFTTHPYARSLNSSDLFDASRYIKNNTAPTEKIFTGDSELAFLADREIIGNFTRYSIYACNQENPDPDTVDPRDIVPSVPKIIEEIDARVRIVAVSVRTGAFMYCQPRFKQYLASHFHKTACFGNEDVCIYEKNPIK